MAIPKTTGHLLSILLLALVLALPAAAAEITLTTSNDPISGNRRPDDLYTAELALGVHYRAHDLEVRERMFTDHERGLRFDETSFEVSRPGLRFAGWRGEAGLGVLHVGRGLLGENVQNAVHGLVGSDREDLRYAADHRFYPRARLAFQRPLATAGGGGLAARVEATAVPGFHSSLQAGLVAERHLGHDLDLRLGVAGVLHDVESDLLGDVISSSGVAWEVGVGWRGALVSYSHNAYGTESRHLTLGYRFSAETVRRMLGGG